VRFLKKYEKDLALKLREMQFGKIWFKCVVLKKTIKVDWKSKSKVSPQLLKLWAFLMHLRSHNKVSFLQCSLQGRTCCCFLLVDLDGQKFLLIIPPLAAGYFNKHPFPPQLPSRRNGKSSDSSGCQSSYVLMEW
jgi:hypothetical protein